MIAKPSKEQLFVSGKTKPVALGAILFLLLAACNSLMAQAQERESNRHAIQVRAKVQKIGTSVKTRVRVKLHNGRKLEGYIGQIGEDHFYVVRTDSEKGSAAVVAFDDVQTLEKRSYVTWREVVYRTGMGAGAVLGFLRDLGATITPAFPAAP
jgi:thymidine kinase